MSAVIELRAPSYRGEVLKVLKSIGCYITAISRDFIGVRSIKDKYEDKPADQILNTLLKSKHFVAPEGKFEETHHCGRVHLTFENTYDAAGYISLYYSLQKQVVPATQTAE